MDSFFFNITDTRYKITQIFQESHNHITRVDISNGIVFLDILLEDTQKEFTIKNLDRMIFIPVVIDGKITIMDNIDNKENTNQQKYITKKDSMSLYCSSKQDFTITIEKAESGIKTKIFILFIADFYLKRYLSSNIQEPIDFLYNNIQKEISLKLINTMPIDALSLYIIEKIVNINENKNEYMTSIKKEHSVIEFIIHRFSMLDFNIKFDKSINESELNIAKNAKIFLLKNFVNPPSIQELAHQCATNESKLKKVFKKVYNTTIYSYIQKLKLEKANILLKDQILNIGQIAKEVGYKHQGHFSKLFFENYGVYPKDLLKN